jgi:hypothetical protein
MAVSAGHIQLFVSSTVAIRQPLKKIRYDRRVPMTHEKIVNMPTYCHLLSVDHLISHARIVWINGIPKRNEICN